MCHTASPAEGDSLRRRPPGARDDGGGGGGGGNFPTSPSSASSLFMNVPPPLLLPPPLLTPLPPTPPPPPPPPPPLPLPLPLPLSSSPCVVESATGSAGVEAEGGPPPTTARNTATTPKYATPRPSLMRSGHMEKHASGGNHAANSGACSANIVTGSNGSNTDFSCT